MYGLVDCNNFYVSCERVFNPFLRNKPVVVLYNNDGCIIARSNESKALGIPMGAPLHQYKKLINQNKDFSDNIEKIFGHLPKDRAEEDFYESVKFLHMAIQNLRNEKAHTPAQQIDKNLAIHYIVLASLAYDLINNRS